MNLRRRAFLKGLASSIFTLPIARELRAEPPERKKRLVLIMQNNGTQQANFWPQAGAFSSPILEPLVSDPRIAARTAVVKGIFIPNDLNGTDGNQHDAGFARMFTGARLLSIGGRPWGGAASIDQIIARSWRTNTLSLAVLASLTEPHPKPGFDHRRSFTYVGPGQIREPMIDPFLAYQQLFSPRDAAASGGALDPKTRQRLQLRKSVLDSIAGDLKDTSRRLGPRERRKLDLHLESVRELETSLSAALASDMLPGFGRNGAACEHRPRAAPRDFGASAPDLLVMSDDAVPELVGDMIDLAASALICDVARIATIQLGYGGGKWRFGWEGIGLNCHDDVAHLDTSNIGSSPANTARVVTMNRWYAKTVADLAKKLDSVPEGEGTVLDNTLIVWANELGRGDHSLANVPIVFIGGAGGALPPGGRLIDVGRQPFNRVGCTVLNLMGIRAEGFGDLPDCGQIQGLV
jgi:uncharacterized protein DUF1552